MYVAGTILELKEQREPERRIDPQTGEPAFKKRRNTKTGELENRKEPDFRPFPYNKVKVVGQSPVVREFSEWTGGDAVCIIIQPATDFAGNIEEPIGKIRMLYNVVEVPEEKVFEPQIRLVQANTAQVGPTPEEVFAREAPGVPPKHNQKRGRTPFDDVKPPPGTHGRSPL